MMINDMKKNELNEQEMANVAGGSYPYDWRRRSGIFPSAEEFKALYEAEQQAAAQEAARQEYIRRAEARKQENQSTIHVHGGGASGSW